MFTTKIVVWSALLVCSSQAVPAFSQEAVLPQGDPRLRAAEDPDGLTRQDTGLADPSVNPGQASGMQSVQGRIIKSDGNTHIVRQLSCPDTTLTVDARTAGDTKLHPGDIVTGLITPQGRAVAIHKEH